MNKKDKEDLVKKIRRQLPNLTRDSVMKGVEIFSKIGIENIIIYCELDLRDLFESDRSFGKDLTFINILHPFYVKVLGPLKEKGEDDILASLELLISSLSRSGNTNFEGNDKEIIKDFHTATAKDLKRILSKTSAVTTKNDTEKSNDKNVLSE